MPLGAWDTNGFAPTWWDVDGNVAGWWDKDAIPFPTAIGPVPSALLYGGGGDEDEDRDYIRFFRVSHGQIPAEDERVTWELGDFAPFHARVAASAVPRAIPREETQRVTVTILIDGVAYVVAKDLP